MTDVTTALSRGQFLRDGAKGGLVLATAGGVLASASGIAFAKGLTKSDITVLQTGYIAETLAVKVYEAILKSFSTFKLHDRDYFVAALQNEKDHQAAWKAALGSRTPRNFQTHIPSSAVSSTKALLATGVALESAFVSTYLGAISEFSSNDLREAAAAVAANEATHYSFFDAAAGGHAVLPSFPKPVSITAAAALLENDGFVTLSHATRRSSPSFTA